MRLLHGSHKASRPGGGGGGGVCRPLQEALWTDSFKTSNSPDRADAEWRVGLWQVHSAHSNHNVDSRIICRKSQSSSSTTGIRSLLVIGGQSLVMYLPVKTGVVLRTLCLWQACIWKSPERKPLHNKRLVV